MICPNPNCKSVIPNDSKFCPDCGTPVKNEEELRRQAKEIVTMYPKGYDYFVSIDSLPRFVYNLRIVNCEKIIAKKQDIIKKHNEILQEEKRIKEAKDLEDKRREVSQIQSTYSKGYYYYAQQNVIPYYGCLSSADCDRVITNKYKIIQMHNEIVAEKKRQKEEELKYEAYLKRKEIIKGNSLNHFICMPLCMFFTFSLFLLLVNSESVHPYIKLGYSIFMGVSGGGYFVLLYIHSLISPKDDELIEEWKRKHINDPMSKYL